MSPQMLFNPLRNTHRYTVGFNFMIAVSLQDAFITLLLSQPTVKLAGAKLVMFIIVFLLQPRFNLCLQNHSRLQSVHVGEKEAGGSTAGVSQKAIELRPLKVRPAAPPCYIQSVAAVSSRPAGLGSSQASAERPGCDAAAACFFILLFW